MTIPSDRSSRPSSPYVGPRPFEEGEPLYGRSVEVRNLLRLLVAERVVLLYSPSGAGKTSLIQSSLIPALRGRQFYLHPPIRVSHTVDGAGSGNRYIDSLLSSLMLTKMEDEDEDVANEAARSTLEEQFDQLRAARGQEPVDEVLIFDQFEEILTVDPTDGPAKRDFFEAIGTVLEDRHRWALFSMREEYIAGLDPYLRAIPTRFANRFRLELLGDNAALDAIRRPAKEAGIPFTDDAARKLVSDLSTVRVQDAQGVLHTMSGPYVEPVQLQVVCRRLWENLPLDAEKIDVDDVDDVGDVDTALRGYFATTVAEVANHTGTQERALRNWFDERLISPQGVRLQVLQGSNESGDISDNAIRPLVDAHLVRAENRRGITWYELAHDRLVEPIRADNEDWSERHLSALQRQAALWDRENRPNGLLITGQSLRDAEAWAGSRGDELVAHEVDFLDACRQLRKVQRREQRQRVGLVLLAMAALVIAAVAVLYAKEADRQRAEAAEQRDAKQRNESRWWIVSAESQQEIDPVVSVHLSTIALPASNTPRPYLPGAEFQLHKALRSSRERGYVMVSDQILTPDRVAVQWPITAGGRIAVGGSVVQVVDPSLTEVLTLTVDLPPVERLAWRDDGAMLMVHSRSAATYTFQAWRNDREVATLSLNQYINCSEWQPEGKLLLLCSPETIWLWDPEVGTLDGLDEIVAAEETSAGFSGGAWGPLGRWLAVIDGHQPQVWNVERGALLDLQGSSHESNILTFAWSPDEESPTLVTGSRDGSAHVWNVLSPSETITIDTGAKVDGIRFLDEERFLTWNYQNGVSGWTRRGRPLDELSESGGVRDIEVSPDGAQFLVLFQDGTAKLRAADTGELLGKMPGHTAPVVDAAWHPTMDYVATAALDGTARIWTENGKSVSTLRGHRNADRQPELIDVLGVHWSADGRDLLTYGEDGTLRRWAVFDADGYPLCTDDGSAEYPACFGYSQVRAVNYWGIDSVEWLPDDTFAYQARDGEFGRIGASNVVTWTPALAADLVCPLSLLDPAATTVLFWDDVNCAPEESAGRLLQVGDDTVRHELPGPIAAAFWLEEGLLVNTQDGTITLSDPTTGSVLATLADQEEDLTAVAEIAAHEEVALGDSAGRVQLWTLGLSANSEIVELLPPTGVFDSVTGLEWTDDGQGLLVAAKDIQLWGREIATTTWTFDDWFVAANAIEAALSEDERFVAAGRDRTLYLLDAVTGKLIWQQEAHDEPITGVQWVEGRAWRTYLEDEADGDPTNRSLILTWAGDGTVRLWDAVSGEEVRRLVVSDHGNLEGVAIDPAGTRLLTAYYDPLTESSLIREWQIWLDDPEEMLDLAADRVTRPLSAQDQADFGITASE